MSYPPAYNGQYPSQYNIHPPQQTIQPQFVYNNVNAVNANANAPAYQYGKPAAYPQVLIQPYQSYGQAYNPQHQPQAPPPPPPQQQTPQYVNPSDIFQQPILPSPSPASFNAQRPSQHGTQSAVPVAGNNRPSTAATPAPPASTPASAPTPVYTSISGPQQTNNEASNESPNKGPPPTPTPQFPPKPKSASIKPPVAVTPPAPSPKPVQVLIPTPSPASQQNKQRLSSKKQTQKQPSQQLAQNPANPGIDYQVLLLAMADEYLNAAHSHGTTIALLRRDMELEEYYRLVATGLGCLEAVLKVFSLILLPGLV